jgi:hypothetical protein
VSAYGSKPYNLDINQLGASQYPRFSVIQDSPYKDAVVEDIILNEQHPEYEGQTGINIGMAKIRLIPDDRNVPKDQLNWAMPLESTIREYPLKNEIVMVFYSVGRLFYTRRVNINNKITESSWPGLSQKFSPLPPSSDTSQEVSIAAQGGPAFRPWGNTQSTNLGDEFAENPSVKMVRPNEGDTIIQGRFGNIIRFGSSLFSNPVTATPQPNLLLTVGQDISKAVSTQQPSVYSLVYEDINKDKSCIWMIVDERVTLDPATRTSVAHLRSTESSDSTKYTGAQIFLNSDRVILNSKVNEISLFAKKEINLSAVESITIDSGKSVFITAERDIEISTSRDLILTARSINLNVTNDISQGTSGNYIISGKKIFIGASPNDTTQPMVLGGELATWLQNLMDAFIVEIPKSIATLNPVPFVKAITELRIKLGAPGIPQAAIFNSTSNFTSKTND